VIVGDTVFLGTEVDVSNDDRAGVGVILGVGEGIAGSSAVVVCGLGVNVGDTVSVTFKGVDPPEQPTMRIEAARRKKNLADILITPPM
jgi:hypothetical protein